MNGREDKKSNDLFYTCSLIEYIARKTKNKPSVITERIGRERISHIYEYADVFHCENIDKITDELVTEFNISDGNFNNVAECMYSVPTHWDIGKVYKRLILTASNESGKDVITVLMEVYSSKMTDLIEDYNSSFYYDNPGEIFWTYKNGCIPA